MGATFPGSGERHGYDELVPLLRGVNNVCVYGINVGRGDNALIACRNITAVDSPFGSFDALRPATEPGGLVAQGWAIDTDTASPIQLHVYVDGVLAVGATAETARCRPSVPSLWRSSWI